jgi:hypothetical protein
LYVYKRVETCPISFLLGEMDEYGMKM